MRLFLLISVLIFGLAASNQAEMHPPRIMKCLEKVTAQTEVVVDKRMNPYYLRGDFDADGAADYVVSVTGRKSGHSGVLFCLGRGSVILLGVDNTLPPFSDMPGDNFISPQWEVVTRRDVLSFRRSNKIVPVPKGEVVLMIWEDGMHYIYWDGARFRWSPLMQ